MTTNGKCLNWLYHQIRKSRIDLAHTEERDAAAAENIRRKIDVIEHLIGLVLKEGDDA